MVQVPRLVSSGTQPTSSVASGASAIEYRVLRVFLYSSIKESVGSNMNSEPVRSNLKKMPTRPSDPISVGIVRHIYVPTCGREARSGPKQGKRHVRENAGIRRRAGQSVALPFYRIFLRYLTLRRRPSWRFALCRLRAGVLFSAERRQGLAIPLLICAASAYPRPHA